jgi:hypothetical protein
VATTGPEIRNYSRVRRRVKISLLQVEKEGKQKSLLGPWEEETKVAFQEPWAEQSQA